MVERAFPVAACVLAESHAAALESLVPLLEGAQLAPIVAVVAQGTAVPVPARAVVVESRRRDEGTALRFGLTQLLNVPLVGALIVDAGGDTSLEPVLAMLDAARRTGAPLVATADAAGPVFAHRDVWREILTAPGGLGEVIARHAGAVVRVPGRR